MFLTADYFKRKSQRGKIFLKFAHYWPSNIYIQWDPEKNEKWGDRSVIEVNLSEQYSIQTLCSKDFIREESHYIK